jgi:nucleotide-binding universal stress UspA family protein
MYKKILAPLDGSGLAECTLDHVKSIATGCNVPEVVLLRVVEPISSFYLGEIAASNAKLASLVEQQVQEQQISSAKQYIDTMVDKLKKDGVAASGNIIVGRAAEDILNYAKNNQVDLIVMSTHGRAGISRWAFGSVADKITRYSSIPVLIVTPTGCRI